MPRVVLLLTLLTTASGQGMLIMLMTGDAGVAGGGAAGDEASLGRSAGSQTAGGGVAGSATAGSGAAEAPVPAFLGDFEQSTATQPYLPFQQPQSHNYANPVDNAHACFGSWFRVTAPEPVWRGTYGAKVILDRYNGTSATQRSQTITPSHKIVVGADDWYTFAFYIPSPGLMTPGLGNLLAEPGFHGVVSPNIGLSYREVNGVPDHLAVLIQSGSVQATTSSTTGYRTRYHSDVDYPTSVTTRIELPGLYAIPPGKLTTNEWHELIMHVRWSDEAAMGGVIETWWRPKGQTTWTKTADTTTGGYPKFPTLEYLPSGTLPATMFDPLGMMYRSQRNNVPTLYYDGIGRWTSLADARAYMQ